MVVRSNCVQRISRKVLGEPFGNENTVFPSVICGIEKVEVVTEADDLP
jgi:hypothetical protein